MDRTADLLADYASSLTYEDLTPEAAHHVRRRLLDSLGCALGAYNSEPARIARKLAGQISHSQPARVIGSGQATSPDMAAFANTVMVRYLDCNDNFFSVAGGHPSDMIPAALAMADSTHSSGAQAMTAIAVAYQAFCSIADQVPLGELGLGPRRAGSLGFGMRRRQPDGTLARSDAGGCVSSGDAKRGLGPDPGGRTLHVEGLRHGCCRSRRSIRGRTGP